MKVKVLEAMASGVPVVTTPAGAEGIEPSDGVVVLEQPAELAAAAVELLNDAAGTAGARVGRTRRLRAPLCARARRPSRSSSSTAEWRDEPAGCAAGRDQSKRAM